MKLLVIQVAALGHDFLLAQNGGAEFEGLAFSPIDSVVPAVTCTAQASFRTAARADRHGMVGNGFYSREFGKNVSRVSPQTMSVLTSYRWPGNIRELQNVLERAVLISDDEVIELKHLPDTIQGRVSFLDDSMRKELSIEEYIRSFIATFQGRYGEQELADKLGITRKTLWEKRKKWGFKRPGATSEVTGK